MIIRSGLIRNRDNIDFAAFSEHWRHVHGPLALRVEAMRAYRQNHIAARLDAPHGDRLHRVDGLSQLWFDDVEAMRVAMNSPEQQACIEDIRGFLSEVTLLIQQEGETRRHGADNRLPMKLIYLLAGSEAEIEAAVEALFAALASSSECTAIRINPVIDRNFSVDSTVSSGSQIIDAVLEIWLPEGETSAVAQRVLTDSAGVGIVGAFQADEVILKSA
ncbi:EthD family reductase [Microvirga zambiensis]|uniref:EthD family reductase n=1 Tax=Microvirga zambiensis TaxID=1402137 RepID=UPI001920064B|nr:EthD family reductase [Microvirga zambiensis]